MNFTVKSGLEMKRKRQKTEKFERRNINLKSDTIERKTNGLHFMNQKTNFILLYKIAYNSSTKVIVNGYSLPFLHK